MSEKVELQGFEVEVDTVTTSLGAEDADALMIESYQTALVAETPEDHDPTPAYGSDEWNDFVMSLFKEDELFNGNPLTAGLRRVTTQLLGPIVSSKPVTVFPSMDPNGPGRATVVYELVIDWMGSGELRVFGDVGEVWHGNTDDLFSAHAAATACTKAEGRCLRKALMVKCLAAEELPNKDAAAAVRNAVKVEAPTTGEMVEGAKISDAQISFIDGKCKQMDINAMKFINSLGETQYTGIRQLNKKVGSHVIQELNKRQTGDVQINSDHLGYDPNWRSK